MPALEKDFYTILDVLPGIEDGAVLRVAGHGLPGNEPDIPAGAPLELTIPPGTQPDEIIQLKDATSGQNKH